jgi:hypothetical protein
VHGTTVRRVEASVDSATVAAPTRCSGAADWGLRGLRRGRQGPHLARRLAVVDAPRHVHRAGVATHTLRRPELEIDVAELIDIVGGA